MESQARVVVIGGGVVGVSTLYHLAKKNWNDVKYCSKRCSGKKYFFKMSVMSET